MRVGSDTSTLTATLLSCWMSVTSPNLMLSEKPVRAFFVMNLSRNRLFSS